MEIYWNFTRNDITYEDFHCQTNNKTTKASLQAYILKEGEIHGHHMEVKLLSEIEQMINEILDNYFSPPHVYPTLYNFLDKFLWRVDKHTTEILNEHFISWTTMSIHSHWYNMIMQRHGFAQFCLLNPAKICKTTELQLLGYKVRDVIST